MTENLNNPDEYLTTAEFCEILQVSPRTMQKKLYRELFQPEWAGYAIGWRYNVAVVKEVIAKLKEEQHK